MTSRKQAPDNSGVPSRRPRFAAVGWVNAQLKAQPILRVLVANAVSLASATILTSALGLAYWLIAARNFSPAAVGFASAAVSGMTLVATFASLGLGAFAIGDAQRDPARRRNLVAVVLIASSVSSAILATVYALLIAVFVSDLRPISATVYGVLIFVACCVATAVGMVLDQSLLGALRGRIQLHRNLLFGVVKLVLVFVSGALLGQRGGLAIFSTWSFAVLASLIAVALVQRQWTRAFICELKPGVATTFVRDVARPVLRHQTLSLALRIPLLALPVLVVSVLSVQANANFYIAWQLTNAAFVLPGSLAGMLYAVGANDEHALAARLKVTLALSMCLTVLAGAVLALASHPIMSLFGKHYARDGATTLAVLAIAGVPTVVKNHYAAVARITGRQGAAAPTVYIGAAVEMLGAYSGGRTGGLAGFSAGWVIALSLEACFMFPMLAMAARGRANVPPNQSNLSGSL